jgi:hypothetical protein
MELIFNKTKKEFQMVKRGYISVIILQNIISGRWGILDKIEVK